MATKGVAAKPKPAVKKAAPAKAKPATAKPAKKAAPAKAVNKKGIRYSCGVCGLIVSVDTACNCVGVCDLVCCSKPMQVLKK
jgi:hypothetical protein